MICAQNVLDALARSEQGAEIMDALLNNPSYGVLRIKCFATDLEAQDRIDQDAHEELVKFVEGSE